MNNPYNDSNALRHEEICLLYGLDPHVHNIKEAEDAPRARLYGWPEAERYPLDTPGRTMLSWAYANEDMEDSERDRVLGNIKKAADFWKIRLPERHEEKAEDAKYVLKISGEGWEDSYRLNTAAEVKSIVDHVRKNASDFSYKTRLQYADGIVGAPRELKKTLSDDDVEWIRRVKGEILTDGASVKRACDERASCMEQMGHPELGEVFRNVAANVKDTDVVDVPFLRKVASAMDLADRTVGADVLYGSVLRMPEFSVEGYTPEQIKKANEDMAVIDESHVTSRNRVAMHRDKVDDFFMKIAGEDTRSLSLDAMVKRLQSMDAVERDAFDDILGKIM